MSDLAGLDVLRLVVGSVDTPESVQVSVNLFSESQPALTYQFVK